MYLDARNGDWNWEVYDAYQCRRRRDVQWIDSDASMYGAYVGDHVIPHRSSGIAVFKSTRLIVINVVPDDYMLKKLRRERRLQCERK